MQTLKRRITTSIPPPKSMRYAPEKWLCSMAPSLFRGHAWPDFIVIGAQKSGTTWLRRNLRCHPELYLPEREVRYFNWRFHKSFNYYLSLFKDAPPDSLKGEVTPDYSHMPIKRIRFIRKLMPDVKLILSLRNPVERAWSNTLMRLVVINKMRYEDIDDSFFYEYFKTGAWQRGNYRRMLDNWLGEFPREQIFICFYDDLKKDSQGYLLNIFDFLGISTDVDWTSFPYNRVIRKGPSTPMKTEFREFLKEMYYEEIEELYRLFGEKVEAWRYPRPEKRQGQGRIT